MQVELKEIQREVGITFVFVTHDQEEALTMSDRIAVFNDGRIEQVGTPPRSTSAPPAPFVAGFVGTSNLLDGDGRAAACSAGAGSSSSGPEKIQLLTRRGGPGHDATARPRAVAARSSTWRLGHATTSSTLDAGPHRSLVAAQNRNGTAGPALEPSWAAGAPSAGPTPHVVGLCDGRPHVAGASTTTTRRQS